MLSRLKRSCNPLAVLAVWPLITLFLIVWIAFFTFTPDEVTQLQSVPRILQGDTDWGGSNIFAAYVTGHFVFGVIGSFLLTRALRTPKQFNNIVQVLVGFGVAFLLINSTFLLLFLKSSLVTYIPASNLREDYFVCDYIQVFLLFILAYLFSIAWIISLSERRIGTPLLYALSPIFLYLLLVVGWNGITPKAGKVLNQYEIPEYSPNGICHGVLLKVHRACTYCTGGWKK